MKMHMNAHHLIGIFMAGIIFTAGTTAGVVFAQVTDDETSTIGDDLGCVRIINGSRYARYTLPECSVSAPWWSPYDSCRQTEIQQGAWKAPDQQRREAMSAFALHPWLDLDSEIGDVVVILWWGSRPFPIEVDATYTPLSIIFPESMQSVTLVGAESTYDGTISFDGVPNEYVGDTRVWDIAGVFPPQTGCWTYTISAMTEAGLEIRVPFTFIAVE